MHPKRFKTIDYRLMKTQIEFKTSNVGIVVAIEKDFENIDNIIQYLHKVENKIRFVTFIKI